MIFFFFTKESEITNYADDNSPYACRESIRLVMKWLEDDSKILLECVSQNALKANPDKFHLLLSPHDEHSCVTVDQYKIYNSKHEKLLGVVIDADLNYWVLLLILI